jgi:hypothetical protein
MKRLLLVAVLALTAGCTKKKYEIDLDALSSFRVTLSRGDPASVDAPYPYTQSAVSFGVQIQAINGRGDPMAWDGRVKITAVPGRVAPSAGLYVDIVGGVGEAPDVSISKAFGPTRVWVEDLGTSAKPGTYATGVSDVLWFKRPSIEDIQTSDIPTRSPFQGQLVTITAGNMVVTQITGDGFYVTDTTASTFNSLYVYARVRAEDLNRGMSVVMLSGAITEYNGMTEMTNPSWDAGEQQTVPDPVRLDCATQVKVGGMAMEPYESGFVEIRDAVINLCDSFQGASTDCPDFAQYGQWTVTLPCGAQLNMITRLSTPRLDPVVDWGKTLPVVRGILTQVAPASPDWILIPRDEADFCFEGDSGSFRGACD